MTHVGDTVGLLRRIALVEGVSFLVLLGVAMPLRHFAGMPRAVTVCGWIHGVLFVLLCAALWRTHRLGWPTSRLAQVFVAALLPFGPFLLDRRMQEWQTAAVAASRSRRRELGARP
ncbi:MAG: DUF3817 domain-containing protein [Planctomycetota bacterium]